MDIERRGEGNVISLNSLEILKELRTLNIFQDSVIINITDTDSGYRNILHIISTGQTPEEVVKQIMELPEIKAHLESIDDKGQHRTQHRTEDERKKEISNLEPNLLLIPKLARPADPIGDFLVLGICAMFVGNYQLAREFFVLIRNCSAVENVPLMHC